MLKFLPNNPILIMLLGSILSGGSSIYFADDIGRFVGSMLGFPLLDSKFSGFVLVTALIFACFFVLYFFTKRTNQPAAYLDYTVNSTSPHDGEAYIQVANNINIRISILEARSLLIYWSMIVVIISGVLLILFSGYLSSLDSYASNLWSLIEQGNPVKQSQFIGLEDKSSPPLTDAQSQQLKEYLTAKNSLTNVMIKALEKRSDDGKTFNVGSTILRISILGMLIFLVQILMQLYRYNSRLITFYSSRRDAIMLSAGVEANTKAFAELLLPTGFDFGKEVHHPFAEVATAVRDGTANLKDRMSGSPKDGDEAGNK